MKKFLKYFFILILILILVYVVYSLIISKVYFDIYTAMKEKVDSEETFYAKLNSDLDEPYKIEQEILIKDNIFIKKITRINKETNENICFKCWQKYLPNKTEDEEGVGYLFIEAGEQKVVSPLKYEDGTVEPENKMYRYNLLENMVIGDSLLSSFFNSKVEDYTYLKILISALKYPSVLYSTEFNGEKVYAIKEFFILGDAGGFLLDEDTNMLDVLFASYIRYFSKETKLPVGTNALPATHEYFTKEVTDEDIKLPNLDEYVLQTNE